MGKENKCSGPETGATWLFEYRWRLPPGHYTYIALPYITMSVVGGQAVRRSEEGSGQGQLLRRTCVFWGWRDRRFLGSHSTSMKK